MSSKIFMVVHDPGKCKSLIRVVPAYSKWIGAPIRTTNKQLQWSSKQPLEWNPLLILQSCMHITLFIYYWPKSGKTLYWYSVSGVQNELGRLSQVGIEIPTSKPNSLRLCPYLTPASQIMSNRAVLWMVSAINHHMSGKHSPSPPVSLCPLVI